MAIQAATHTSAQIISRCARSAGILYSVEDSIGTHTVTVADGCTDCSCGLDAYSVHCSHRLIVEAQEQAYKVEAQLRASFVSMFGIY